jgi:hypothetical protein
LGKALKSRRADMIISTKIGFRSGASYGYVLSAAEHPCGA